MCQHHDLMPSANVHGFPRPFGHGTCETELAGRSSLLRLYLVNRLEWFISASTLSVGHNSKYSHR